MSVVGARPQFVKLGPIARACTGRESIEHIVVHTGQHYDPLMSDVFFSDLQIPAPAEHLGVGSGSHGRQTGAILSAMDSVLEKHSPDWVLAYGDTNSTVAAALAAAKMHVPLAHLEAGLRSGNRQMPEEHNRVVTDHLSDLLLAPTQIAADNLHREGLEGRTVVVGDVMTDVCFATRDSLKTRNLDLHEEVDVNEPFILATIHRADNTDHPSRLQDILQALKTAPIPVVLAAHPRLVQAASRYALTLTGGSLHTRDPLSYPEMVLAIQAAQGIVTDSGGLQKEAFLLGTPVTTIRTETEWVETLVDGWNVLDPDLSNLHQLMVRKAPSIDRRNYYGDGQASIRVLAALLSFPLVVEPGTEPADSLGRPEATV